ncbi:hypothetical protein DFH28DRAFT_879129, partial [Melampsora americana]
SIPVPQIVPRTLDAIDSMDADPLAAYNQKVCAAWRAVKSTPDYKIFKHGLFLRLANVISNDVAMLQPHEHLSAEEEEYRSTFERLVNLKKVKEHLALNRNTKQIAKYQEKGIAQMELIHSSLQLAHKTYGLQYHLMAASWNPTTTNPYAGWSKEFSSDPVYLTTFSFSNHLLERFDRFVTSRDSYRKSKTPTVTVTPNDQLRKDFTMHLNQLVLDHLKDVNPKLIKPRVHIHPKGKNCDVLLRQTSFPNDICLAVHQTSDSKVTPEMLSAGPAAIMNDKCLMHTWNDDINSRRYTVIVVPKSNILD